MEKLQQYKKDIRDALLTIERQSTFSAKTGLQDFTKSAEEFYRGLLNLFYSWELKNANTEETPNYEGVDLLFKGNNVSVQVTSESTSEKVHDSIKGFKNKALLEGYEVLYILMFKGKPSPLFPRAKFMDTVTGAFIFDKNKHIIDHSDLMAKLEDAEFDHVKSIYDYLEKYGCFSYANADYELDDFGIIAEIFEYIQENRLKTANKSLISDPDVGIKKKIQLNFSKEQKDIVNGFIISHWEKKALVREFIGFCPRRYDAHYFYPR